MSDGGDPDDETDDHDDPFEVIEESDFDPFERLDVDREGDPTARIDGPDVQPGARDSETDPFEEIGPEAASERAAADATSGESTTSDGPAPDAGDDPFAGLGREERGSDPFAGLDAQATEAGASAQPDADLWEALSRGDVEPETETHGQRRFAEVSKHSYCERCEYFSEPPEIACSNEGTDIVEFVDFETVRVADCPVVAEREQLADMDRER